MLLIVEILSVWLVLGYMYFAAKRNANAWIFGVLASVLSVYLFYKQHLIGSSILNAIYGLQGVLGYINWKKFISGQPPGYYLKWQYHVLWIVACFLVSWIGYECLAYLQFKEMLFVDLLLAAGSILATSLEIRKDTSCWWYWIICNTSYAALYFRQSIHTDQSLFLYAILMLALAVFSYMALRAWEKDPGADIQEAGT